MARYIPSGVAKVVFAPAVSSIAAPTQAEIAAGTVLTSAGGTLIDALAEMNNWETAVDNIDVPDVQTTFDSQIPGRTKASNPTTMHYDNDAAATIRTALAEGTAGYMIIMRYGSTTGKRAEVYPCKVSSLNDSQVDNKNTPAMFTVTYAVSSKPNKVAVIAA